MHKQLCSAGLQSSSHCLGFVDRTFVNDENCILPFDCTEKEAFIECGRGKY